MKTTIKLPVLLLIANLTFSQQKNKEQIDLSLLKSDKLNLFDASIFKPKKEINRSFNAKLKAEKTISKMPIFKTEGNYTLRIVKVDTLKKHSLKIYKIE